MSVIPEDLPDLSSFNVKSHGDTSVPKVLDDEFAKLGYSDNARLSILGDVGRENNWNRSTIFKGHSDPKNGAYNRGIISWQGDRQTALNNHLKQTGVYGKNNDDELRGMAQFMDSELRTKFPQVHNKLINATSTAEASEALRQYIKYNPFSPYNSPDPNFRVKNNADWANKAKRAGLGQLPDLSAFTQTDLPDLSHLAITDSKGGQPVSPTVETSQTVQPSALAGADPNVAPTVGSTPIEAVLDDPRGFDPNYQPKKSQTAVKARQPFQTEVEGFTPQEIIGPDGNVVSASQPKPAPITVTDAHGQQGAALKGAFDTIPVSIEDTPDDREIFKRAMLNVAAHYGKTPEDVDKFVDARNGKYFEGAAYTPDELKAIRKEGHPTIGATVANSTVNDFLKSTGESDETRITPPLSQDIAQKNAEYRTEYAAPDLHVGRDFTKDDAETLREKFGDTAATGLASLLAVGGKTSTMLAGLVRLTNALNPVQNAESSILGKEAPSDVDDIYKYLKEAGETANNLVTNSGAKQITYDENGRPVISDKLGSTIEKKSIEIAGDLARLYAMGSALPGASSLLGKMGEGAALFGTQNALETAGQGASPDEIKRQTLKGIATGGLFGVAGAVGNAATDVIGTLANKAIPKALTEGLTLGTIAGGTYGIDKIAGDSDTAALQESIVNSLFHVAPRVLGKTVEFVGSKLKARVSDTGEVTVAPADAKPDVAIETKGGEPKIVKVTEPVADAVADDLRKKVAPPRLPKKEEVKEEVPAQPNLNIGEDEAVKLFGKMSADEVRNVSHLLAQEDQMPAFNDFIDKMRSKYDEAPKVIQESAKDKLEPESKPEIQAQDKTATAEKPTSKTNSEGVPEKDYGASNKIVTPERAQKAREILAKKLTGNQLNVGLDPDVLQAGAELAAFHIEAGARDFKDFSQRMIQEVGEHIKPVLEHLYDVGKSTAEKAKEKGVTFLTAWHGSPHTFDKFDSSKIGTGEGAQAYGHGLYFTDAEQVAEHYREGVSAMRQPRVTRIKLDEHIAHDLVGDLALRFSLPYKLAEKIYDLQIRGTREHVTIPTRLKNEVEKETGWSLTAEPTGADVIKGAKYRVDLKPDADSYLLWGKPLSEQSEKVKNILRPLMKGASGANHPLHTDMELMRRDSAVDSSPGQNIYQRLVANFRGDKAKASDYLQSLGIRGIKYLDGNSRSGGKVEWKEGADKSQYDRLAKGVAENYLESSNGNLKTAIERLDEVANKSKQYADAAKALKNGDLIQKQDHNYVIFDHNDIEIKHVYGADNKIITPAKFADAKAILSKKLSESSHIAASGFPLDPEALKAALEVATFHIEAGARKFGEFSKRMVDEFGDAVKPHLEKLYSNARDEHKFEGMDAVKTPIPLKSKVGLSVEAKAIEKGLTDTFGDTAEYSPTTIKDQAAQAAKVLENPQAVKDILSGAEKLPDGLRTGAFIKAVEDRAQASGDVETLRDLAKSPLTAETSLHAQELRMLRERNPASPVNLIKDVQKTREDIAKKRGQRQTVQDVIKDIKREVERVKPKPRDWAAFVDSIKC